MRRGVEQIVVGPERGLRAIAVMHVEIDHRYAVGAVLGARMQRGDGDLVEQAEAHGARRLGVVAGRAHGAEGVVGFAFHDLVDGMDGGAARTQSRLPASRRDDGVGIEPCVVTCRNGGANHLDIGFWMQKLDGRELGERSLLALERLEGRRGERVVDGAQTVRPLGMAVTRIVQQAGRMGEQ